MNKTVKYISALIGLVVLQTLVLNQVNINGLINPYVFPLFILLFPFDTKPWVLMLSAFFLGLLIDLFNGTMGMHVFSLTLMAYLRPFFLSTFQPKSDKYNVPSLKNHGFSWILLYVTTLLAVHHLSYFYIEAGHFTNFFHTLSLFFLSLITSVFIIILLLFTFNANSK